MDQHSRSELIRSYRKGYERAGQKEKTQIISAIVDGTGYVWAASNFLCGKRLKPFPPEMVKSLKRHKEIRISKEDEVLLLTASAATIDRLLAAARKEFRQNAPLDHQAWHAG